MEIILQFIKIFKIQIINSELKIKINWERKEMIQKKQLTLENIKEKEMKMIYKKMQNNLNLLKVKRGEELMKMKMMNMNNWKIRIVYKIIIRNLIKKI
jgi:hypothetical protein